MSLSPNNFHLLPMDENMHGESISKLLKEYISWAEKLANTELHFNLLKEFGTTNLDLYIESLMEHLGEYSPPTGLLLVVKEGTGKIVGLGALKQLHEKDCEIKRMFVTSEYRGHKLGRQIVEGLISNAKEKGYHNIYLDSAVFMTTAHNLYKSVGFKEIQPYEGSEIPKHLQKYWKFMKLDLH